MDQDQTERMTPFDELVTSPTLQIMKLLIPYTPFSGRRMLASFIKFIELQRTIRLFGQRSLADPFSTGNSDQNISSPFDLIDSFRPYLNKKDAEMLDTLIQLKEMMSFMEMMQPQDGRAYFPQIFKNSSICTATCFHPFRKIKSTMRQMHSKRKKTNFKKYLKSFIERNYQYERLDE